MKKTSRLVLFALLVLVSACSTPNPGLRAGTVDHGKLSKVGDVWLLELDGSPVERGKAEGLLLGEQIRWLLPRYLKKVASVETLSNYQKELVAAIAAGIPSAHFDQLNALADAAKVDRTALFAVNLAPELLSSLACSCLATTAERSSDKRCVWRATSIGQGAICLRKPDWWWSNLVVVTALPVSPGLGSSAWPRE
jgi:hypothetical protein